MPMLNVALAQSVEVISLRARCVVAAQQKSPIKLVFTIIASIRDSAISDRRPLSFCLFSAHSHPISIGATKRKRCWCISSRHAHTSIFFMQEFRAFRFAGCHRFPRFVRQHTDSLCQSMVLWHIINLSRYVSEWHINTIDKHTL